jgi:tripartite-type tricarboxylate transporter receptor subunit TctC
MQPSKPRQFLAVATQLGRSLRCLLVAALMLGSAGIAALAQTPTWPARTVTVVVGFDVGGVTDVVPRVFSRALSKDFGQTFIVENKPGAAGLTAAAYVARAEGDGYTLLYAAAPQMLAAAKLRSTKLNLEDFAPVTTVGANSFVLVIKPTIPAKTVPEFVSYARTHSITYGSPGAGSITHLLSALFFVNAGLDASHVPFRGGDQALMALLGDQIDMYFSPVGNVASYAGTNQVTLLAVAAEHRLAQLPGVPPLGEFYPNTVLPSWNGFMAPARTPKPIIDRLAQSVIRSVKDPEILAMMEKFGIEPQGQTPDEFAASLGRDDMKFNAAIEAAKLK